jgi:hypothetical protein
MIQILTSMIKHVFTLIYVDGRNPLHHCLVNVNVIWILNSKVFTIYYIVLIWYYES